MHGYNLVAIYETATEAERVRDRLIAQGLTAADVRLSRAPATQAHAASGEEKPGFFGWLFGGDMPERDRDCYASQLHDGRTAVSVRVGSEQLHRRAVEIMEEFNPVDIDAERAAEPRPAMHAAPAAPASGRERVEQGERVIPVVKEELSVGKREAERRYRIKTYVIERPVEQQVNLRDERVEIEHRPVSGAAARDARMPQQREMEIVERHEEPVVEKRGRAVEEVVVRKEVKEHPETVRGTVHETKVDVEKEPAAEIGRDEAWAVGRAGPAKPGGPVAPADKARAAEPVKPAVPGAKPPGERR